MTFNYDHGACKTTAVSQISVQEVYDDGQPQIERPGVVPVLAQFDSYRSQRTVTEIVSRKGTEIHHNSLRDTDSPPLSLLLRTWKWELFTWILGTSGFAANIVLLLCFDGKRQSHWKSQVQITTMVAALAQLSQSALLVPVSFCIGQLKWTWLRNDRTASDVDRFDLASRGPDGSVRLLYRLGWRPRLVSLGAIITVLLLGFPSFIQQAVTTVPRAYPLPGEGLARLQRLVDFTNTSTLADSWDVFAAMDNGLINDKVYPSNASGTCPTEQCSWQPYTSFGVCSATEDITSALVRERPDWPALFPLGNHSFERTDIGDHDYQNGSTFQIDTRWIYSDYPTPLTSNGELPDLAQIYLSYYDPCMNRNKDPEWRNLKYWKGYKVSFKLCLLTLNSTYVQTMRTEILEVNDSIVWNSSKLPSGGGLVQRVLFCSEHRDSNSTSSDKYCIRSDKIADIGERLDWAINPNMMWASYIPIPLNSSETASGGKEFAYQMTYGDRAQYLLPDVLGKNSIFTCRNETAIGFTGFKRKMDNVATSLSNSFRTYPDFASTRVNGTAYKTEPHIEVAYVWLTMPILLYCAVTIFLFATMYHTRNAPPWKSSILALLQCMDPENRLGTSQQVDQFGRRTKIRLEEVRNGETWQLLDTTSSRQSIMEEK